MPADERYAQLGLRSAAERAGIAPLDSPAQAAAAREFARLLQRLRAAAGELNLEDDAVHLAAEIAALEPELDYDARFALIVLITASLAAVQEGSTRLPVSGPQAQAALRRLLQPLAEAALGEGGTERLIARIGALLAPPKAPHVIGNARGDYRPLIYLAPYIYHQRLLVAEIAGAGMIAQRLAAPAVPDAMASIIAAALADVVQRPARLAGREIVLSDEQRAAVERAAANRLSLISGGPGTGKTSVVVAILRVLGRTGLTPGEIALAAPTGKAALRLGESIREGLANVANPSQIDRMLADGCPEPQTVHRLLGYSPARHRFRHHRANPIPAGVVVVDESSMLDLVLMRHLLAAVPDTAKVIMLGDASQLPSVAAGAVFRDLVVAAGANPALTRNRSLLTRNYRIETGASAGTELLALATAIARGDASEAEAAQLQLPLGQPSYYLRASADQVRFEGVELLQGGGDPGDLLERWFDKLARPQEVEQLAREIYVERSEGFDAASRARIERLFELTAAGRILCVTRVFPFGAEQVNLRLHRRALGDSFPWNAWLPGEPVMVVRNDYERMLFNGDQGVLLRVRRAGAEPALMVVFRRHDGFVAFHVEAMRSALELCYATTVHKAQGSEFDAVALLLPDRLLPILTREVVYTAITRARRSVVIAGATELLAQAIARRLERYTGLAEEIAAVAEPPRQ